MPLRDLATCAALLRERVEAYPGVIADRSLLEHVLTKLDLRDRIQVVIHAHRHGLV